jgi:hypothetical protein
MPRVTLLVAYLPGFVNFFGCEADIRRASFFCSGITWLSACFLISPRSCAATLAVLRSVAADCGVGLTSHQTVIRRALAGVETVDQRIADLQKNGGMKDINAEFKAARKVRTVVCYHDFLHTKKLAMLEAIARRL